MSAEAQRRWRERHPDRAAEVQRRYLDNHREKVAAYKRGQRERMTTLERHLQGFVGRANRRAKLYGIPGRLSVTSLRSHFGPCAYCGAQTVSWDHVIPLRAGGPNDLSNLVPSCLPCNRRRPQPWQRETRPEITRASWARLSPAERHERIHKSLTARFGQPIRCRHCVERAA